MAKQRASKKFKLFRPDPPRGVHSILGKTLWAIHALGRNGDGVQVRLLHPVNWIVLPILLTWSAFAGLIQAIPEIISDWRSLVCWWNGESERSNEK